MPTKSKNKGTIYIIASFTTGLVKIGFTDRDPTTRFQQIQSQCPAPLFRAPLFRVGRFPGTRMEEQKLHERFRIHRAHGEWFRIRGAVATFAVKHEDDWWLDRFTDYELQVVSFSAQEEKGTGVTMRDCPDFLPSPTPSQEPI